jgi:uncharacterized alkaline shock family protein YloU
MAERSVRGRSLVTHRALVDIVRRAVLGSYGVAGFADDGSLGRIGRAVGLIEPGIRITTAGTLAVDLRLTVAHGLPIAEVARQVESAVRYGLSRALDREPDRIQIHIGGLRYEPASALAPFALTEEARPPATEVLA